MARRSRLLVLDGDIFIYRFAWANQYKIHWDEHTVSEVINPLEIAIDEMEKFIRGIVQKCGCDGYVIALSHARDFRFRVCSTYQANRQNLVAPEHKEALRKHIEAKHLTIQYDWLEADDVLGILATKEPGRVIMGTIDKDLRQIPGYLYNWNLNRRTRITKADATMFFYCQILSGDPTDNIKGVPGIGPKKAAQYLSDLYGEPEEKLWARVCEIYHKNGLSESDALKTARLVRILRYDEYDFVRSRPILWRPPSGSSD